MSFRFDSSTVAQFNAGVSVPVQGEPEVIQVANQWAHKGKSFRAERYEARPASRYKDVDPYTWRWWLTGPLLTQSGKPYRDGTEGARLVDAEDVPLYARQALHGAMVENWAEVHRAASQWLNAAAAGVARG